MPAETVSAPQDLYDEWSSGLSVVNPGSNNFFEEIPTELEHPSNFQVTPEQLPPDPAQPASPVEEEGPEVLQVEGGGTVTIEKTSRGWKAVLSPAEHETNIPTENFYGENKTKLIANLAKGKLEASRSIRKLKRDKMLGGDEPISATVQVTPRKVATANVLTADDVYEIKNKISENPVEAIDAWVKKRFGLDPEEFAEALKSAPEAKRMLDAQNVKSSVEEVNNDFVSRNPDYLEYVSSEDDGLNRTNIRILVGRMAKAFLNKKITKSSPQQTVDDTIYELYSRGVWTVDNLETAKEELVENGLFERPAPSRQSAPPPQPVAAQSGPSVPAASRIAATTGQPVGLVGFPARSSTPATIPDDKPLTDVDLQKMPLDQLRLIAQAQLKAMNK